MTQEMNKIREYSTKRVDKSEAFKLIEQYAKRLKNERDNQVYSLNIMKYKQELKLDKEANKKNDLVTNYKSRLKFDYLSDDQAALSMDTVKQSKAKTWVGQLQKDVYLEEAVNVMQDMLK